VKINDVPSPAARDGTARPPDPRGDRARILAYLVERPDEVFSATGCGEVAEALRPPPVSTGLRQRSIL